MIGGAVLLMGQPWWRALIALAVTGSTVTLLFALRKALGPRIDARPSASHPATADSGDPRIKLLQTTPRR
jgi:hypothetical protein